MAPRRAHAGNTAGGVLEPARCGTRRGAINELRGRLVTVGPREIQSIASVVAHADTLAVLFPDARVDEFGQVGELGARLVVLQDIGPFPDVVALLVGKICSVGADGYEDRLGTAVKTGDLDRQCRRRMR